MKVKVILNDDLWILKCGKLGGNRESCGVCMSYVFKVVCDIMECCICTFECKTFLL